MKRNGKQYNQTDLKGLLNIVNAENIIHVDAQEPYELVDGFQDVLNYLEEKDSSVIPQKLRKLLFDLVDNTKPGKMYMEESENLKTFPNI